MKIKICKHCKNEFDVEDKPTGWLGNHTRWCDQNPNKHNYKNIASIEAMNRKKTESGVTNQFTKAKIEGTEVISKLKGRPGTFTNKTHTEESKEKIRQKRIEYLKNNPDKHPWKHEKKKNSVPCKKVKDFLTKKGIMFIEEHQPLVDRYFSIDIAFPDIKIGIEINGNQHYDSNGNLLPYYQERHDLIEHTGWKLLEIHYSTAFNEEQLEKLIDIKEQPDYTQYFLDNAAKKSKKIPKVTYPRGVKHKMNGDIKWEPYKELVLNSGIEFDKFGWVNKVSKILGISPQKIKKWMKRYLPEFYDQHCFKRKI